MNQNAYIDHYDYSTSLSHFNRYSDERTLQNNSKFAKSESHLCCLENEENYKFISCSKISYMELSILISTPITIRYVGSPTVYSFVAFQPGLY
jgi:hypothetical protein